LSKISVGKVQPTHTGVEIFFVNELGDACKTSNVRASSQTFDHLLFRFESSSGFLPIDRKLSKEEAFPFEPEDFGLCHFQISDDRIFLSYPLIYAIAFGHISQETGLSDLDLRALAIPKYQAVRARVSAIEDYRHPQFKMRLEIYDRFAVRVTPEHVAGSFYSFNDQLHFLTPLTHKLILRYKHHEVVRQRDEYKESSGRRKEEYASLREVAIKAGAQLDTFIAQESVIFLESLPYEITRDALNRPVIAPVLPWDKRDLDFSFQSRLERNSDDALPDHIPIQKDKTGKRIRVAFSETAWNEYQFIRGLSENQELLEEVVADPRRFFTSVPRVPIEDVFSERVAGFILGKNVSNRSDTGSGQDWSGGFDETSIILRTGKASFLRMESSPMPAEYELLKNAYKKLFEEITKVEEGLLADSGLEFTPLPPQLERRILIEELGAEVSLTELHNVCKAIEIKNSPKVLEEDIPKALETIAAAEASESVIVKWFDEQGVPNDIPLESLRKGLPKLKVESERLHVSPEIGEAALSTGGAPNWDWKSVSVSAREGLIAFKGEVALKPHQEVGYSWLRWLSEHQESGDKGVHKGALLADDMGLGKTIQLLALITHRILKSHPNQPVLIVAPMSLINDSWKKDAIEAFLVPNALNCVDFKDCPVRIDNRRLADEAILVTEEMTKTGKPFHQCAISADLKDSINKIQEWCNGKIVFCSYETLRSKSVILASLKFSTVVLDEAQKIKNVGVLQSNAAKALNADFYVAMSGTPIENSLMDLWGIMDFAVPGKLGDQANFRERFVNKIKSLDVGSPERSLLREELESALKPVWLRRLKSDIYKDGKSLPKIIHHDSVESLEDGIFNFHSVVMSQSQRILYEQYMGIYNSLKSGHRLAAIRSLLEVCASPWLATETRVCWENHQALFDLCPKLQRTFDILEDISNNSEELGKKVVIFANTIQLQISLAYLIADWYRKTKNIQLEVEVFNGEKTAAERTEILKRFKSKTGFQALIISPRSGGTGLNIVEANHVIHYTREWNPALENQATARCYRIGQERDVQVYYPTTSTGDKNSLSAEEHLAGILRSKRDVIDDFTISLEDFAISEEAFAGLKGDDQETQKIRIDLEKVTSLDPIQFEKLVTLIFARRGYLSKWLGTSGDRGADIAAMSGNENYLIQTKHTQRGLIQHGEGINEVRGAQSVYEKQLGKRFKLAVVTNSRFSEQAMILAHAGSDVALWDRSWLNEQLNCFPIFLNELDGVSR
jgi:superfamily II DNA or RNA helicase